jgi:GNAT superfamily N-acetyltransferase
MTEVIRLAREADAADVARLTRELGYGAEVDAIADRMKRLLARDDHRLAVAERDGVVVGWLHALRAEHVEVDSCVVIGGLVVGQGHRGQGVGRALMANAEQWAREIGCSVVRLWSSEPRTAAHRFYERLGYTRIKTHYAFAKRLDDRAEPLSRFVPRVDA